MLVLYIISIELALIAFTWVNLLTGPDDIFKGFPPFIQKTFKNPIIDKLTWRCERCIAGQMMFWYYIFMCLLEWIEYNIFTYNLFEHILFTFISIFTSAWMNKLWNRR